MKMGNITLLDVKELVVCFVCLGYILKKTQTAFKEWLLHILSNTITALTSSVVEKFLITLGLIIPHFVGSASSLIACYEYGFDFIGFEIDKDYYEAAQKRLQAVMSQVSMFREAHHEK